MRMRLGRSTSAETFLTWPAVLVLILSGPWVSAQKVKVGYDKSVDFSRFKTYSRAEIATSPQRPLLYETVVSSIDAELQSKGLTKVENNGDLTATVTGGVDFGIMALSGNNLPSGPPPTINSTVWTGPSGASNGTNYSSEGVLTVTLIERATNKEIWSGSVTQHLDPEDKQDSLDRAHKAITKLFKRFPPR